MSNKSIVATQSEKPAIFERKQLMAIQSRIGRSSADIHNGGTDYDLLVSWRGDKFLKHVMSKRRSGLVVGPDGVGKTSAASELSWDEDVPEFTLIPALSTAELYEELWSMLELPRPRVSYLVKQQGDNWRCVGCKRRCKVGSSRGVICTPPNNDDLRDTMMETGGNCYILRREVNNNIHKIAGTLVIKVPEPLDNDLINTLERLATNQAHAILLVNQEQKNTLWKYTVFRSLPVWNFPAPPLSVLRDVLDRRLGQNSLPITDMGLMLLAYWSGGLTGKFLSLTDRLIDNFIIDELQETVDEQYVLYAISETLDDTSLILACLPRFQGQWFSPTDMARSIKQLFRCNLTVERIGRLLANLQLRCRKGHQYREYYFDDITGGFKNLTSGGCGGFLPPMISGTSQSIEGTNNALATKTTKHNADKKNGRGRVRKTKVKKHPQPPQMLGQK